MNLQKFLRIAEMDIKKLPNGHEIYFKKYCKSQEIDMQKFIKTHEIYFKKCCKSLEIDLQKLKFCKEIDIEKFLKNSNSNNSSYLNTRSKSGDTYNDSSMYDTKSSWNNHIHNCTDKYLYSTKSRRRTCMENSIPSGSDSDIFSESGNTSESSTNLDMTQSSYKPENYKHLWVCCENCYQFHYKKCFKEQMNICEKCGYHLKMSSSERIELPIDRGTWNPMDEDMVSLDPIEFDSEEEPYKDRIDSYPIEPGVTEDKDEEEPYTGVTEEEDEEEDEEEPYTGVTEEEPYKDRIDSYPREPGLTEDEDTGLTEDEEEPYKDRIDSYQRETGLTEAVQTGIGQVNGIPVAIGVMDFQFIGGSMGAAVGEKITRLIEYATKNFLPLILVCASGGARMQEGSLSLMQMAKISAALYDYQSNKKLLYVSILTSPTTGGVTASFGMLGDIIIAEPNAYIAFAGKRVIEQLLNTTVPEGSQEAENLFDKGLFDPIVPRNLLKGVLSELFKLHGFFPLSNSNEF